MLPLVVPFLPDYVDMIFGGPLKMHAILAVDPADPPAPPCVEINQCVGCTRQFFTKSFLGDGATVLTRSSGEEPASPRHRAGIASTAWRTTR